MTTIIHKDVGLAQVILEWTGSGKRFVFVKSKNIGYSIDCRNDELSYTRSTAHNKSYYCLWGLAGKPIEELAAIECLTGKGNSQIESSALKLFWKLVKSAEFVTLK